MKIQQLSNKVLAIVVMFTIVIGAGAAIASTNYTNHKKAMASLYWYPVDPSTNLTTGAAQYHDTKSNVVSNPNEACKDGAAQPICLFGSSLSNLASGTNVGSPAPANRILETTP